jgi:hypothetical protein
MLALISKGKRREEKRKGLESRQSMTALQEEESNAGQTGSFAEIL